MEGDLFPTRIVNAQDSGLLPNPNLAADVLRRHRVIGPFKLNVAITVNAAPGFLENREQSRWQRLQRGSLDCLKTPADLLTRCAVNARVRRRTFPLTEE